MVGRGLCNISASRYVSLSELISSSGRRFASDDLMEEWIWAAIGAEGS